MQLQGGVPLWGSIVSSPMWWAYYSARFLITLVITTLLVIIDLLATLGSIVWSMLSNIIPIVIIAIITILLVFMHIYWPQFVNVLVHDIFPVMQYIIDEIIRFAWNTLFVPIAGLCIEMWDACVQLIGFIIEIALNFLLTMFNTIVTLVTQADLPGLLDQVLEIITPLVDIAISLLQTIIEAGSALLTKLIPIVITLVRFVFKFLPVILDMIVFALKTIFFILKPVLGLVVFVVRVLSRMFHIHHSGRAVLAASGLKGYSFVDRTSSMLSGVIFASATMFSVEGDYSMMSESVDSLIGTIMRIDSYDLGAGGGISDSIPSYGKHVYGLDDTGSGGGTTWDRMHSIPAPSPTGFGNRARSVDDDDDASTFEDLGEEYYQRLEDEYLDIIRVASGGDDENPDQRTPGRDFTYSSSSYPSFDLGNSTVPGHHAEDVRANFTSCLDMHKGDPYACVPKEHHWRVDYTHNKTSEEVFPALKGKKLVFPRLDDLNPEETVESLHQKRKMAIVYSHGLRMAFRRMHKRYVSTGRASRVIGSTFKAVTGHDSLHSLMATYHKRYASVNHFIYDNIPPFHDWGVLRWWKLADPDYEPDGYWHDWVKVHFGEGGIPRELWEEQERVRLAQEYGVDGAVFACQADDEVCDDSWVGVRSPVRPWARALKSSNFISLPILTDRDCMHKPKNPLCIPMIPKNFLIPFVNLSEVVIVSNLADNPECAKYGWHPTKCYFCWELRFSIYWIDILQIILIFGLFVPRFTYLLWKLGKTFSLVRPIVDLILVNKDGSFPNGQEWGCYFEYLNYLFYGIVGFLIWYFIAGPILQGWFWTRTRAAYVTWWGAVMLEYDARTAKIEFYDEQMLVGIRNSFHARDLEQSKNINYVAQGANQKSIGDDISSAPDRVEIWVDGKPSDHRGRHSRISRFSRINPAQAVELSRMEMEIERLKKSIVFNVRVLADHVGNDVIVVDDTPSKHSQRNRIWKVVTSVARMTYIFTPSYIDHVSSHEERTRYLSPPPEMGDESRR